MTRPTRTDHDVALEQVVDLFWTRGYHDVCVEDIVLHTGLNRHSLYGRYGNKMGLFRAALDRYLTRIHEALDMSLARRSSPTDALQRLLALRDPGLTDGSFWQSIQERGCFAARTAEELGPTHPEFKQAMNDLAEGLSERVKTILQEGQESGEFRNDRPARDLAAVVVCCFMAPLLWPGVADRTRSCLDLIAA